MTNLKGNVPRFLYFPSLVFIADSCKILILDFKLLTEEIDANKVPCLLAGEKFTVSKGTKKSWKRSLTTHNLSLTTSWRQIFAYCGVLFHSMRNCTCSFAVWEVLFRDHNDLARLMSTMQATSRHFSWCKSKWCSYAWYGCVCVYS